MAGRQVTDGTQTMRFSPPMVIKKCIQVTSPFLYLTTIMKISGVTYTQDYKNVSQIHL